MTDTARTFIEAVAESWNAAQGEGVQEKAPFAIGEREASEHTILPRVAWTYGSISHGPAEIIGGVSGSMATELQTLNVELWNDTHESTRALKNAVLAMCKQVSGEGAELGEIGAFEWKPEAHSDSGEALAGTIVVKLPVPKKITATTLARITAQTHKASVTYQSTDPVPTTEEIRDTAPEE